MVYAKGCDPIQISKDLRTLFLLTEPRGRQAAGLALAHHNTISVYKRPETASLMLRRPGFKKFVKDALSNSVSPSDVEAGPTGFLGHCRLVTNGSELDSCNNQPIYSDSLVGVHNGVVNNAESLRKQMEMNISGETDSEVFFEMVAKLTEKWSDPVRSLFESFGRIEGSASVGLIHSELPVLLIATNFGSLYYSISVEMGFLAFASEHLIVNRFLKKRKISNEIVKMAPSTGALIDMTNLSKKEFPLQRKSISKTTVIEEKLFSCPSHVKKLDVPYTIINKTPTPNSLKRCKLCILPENYPFLEFDENGVCSHCTKYIKQECHGKQELEQFLSKYRSRDGSPDCIVGLSGGRDSSYGLHVLKTEFGMNPIGVSYDWLLTSRKARHNIAKVAGALEVEVIYRCGNYERQAGNIRKNIYAFLKDPDLGMMTFVQAGDKEMYHYGRKIRREVNVDLTVWCSGYQLEQREFFIGYCGINKTLRNNPRLYGYGWGTKLRLAIYYVMKTLKNPRYINSSIFDNAMAFWHCFIARDDFLYLYNYYPWHEKEVESVLNEEYGWEADVDYGENQWRMDDFHTSFINYVYYTVGGFSEFDDFRSNQIREGFISRQEALKLAERDNELRLDSLRQFSELVGFNLEHVLKRIEAIPKLY